MTASILLLGESPPPKAPPDFIPFDCQSGTNLARFLGLKSRAEVLAHLPRANCFDVPTGVGDDTPKWDDAQARINTTLQVLQHKPRVVVALGRRPAAALGVPATTPMTTWTRIAAEVLPAGSFDVLHVPHPSSRSTSLNTEAKRAEARRAMLVEVVLGCPTLRPWHFRLDEPGVLADLGAALCPLRPALGVAACVIMNEIKAHADRVTAHAAEYIGKRASLVALASVALSRVDIPLRNVAVHAAAGPSSLSLAIAAGTKELTARERNAENTMPEVKDYPAVVLRAIYGRHVALGVAP